MDGIMITIMIIDLLLDTFCARMISPNLGKPRFNFDSSWIALLLFFLKIISLTEKCQSQNLSKYI